MIAQTQYSDLNRIFQSKCSMGGFWGKDKFITMSQ